MCCRVGLQKQFGNSLSVAQYVNLHWLYMNTLSYVNVWSVAILRQHSLILTRLNLRATDFFIT